MNLFLVESKFDCLRRGRRERNQSEGIGKRGREREVRDHTKKAFNTIYLIGEVSRSFRVRFKERTNVRPHVEHHTLVCVTTRTVKLGSRKGKDEKNEECEGEKETRKEEIETRQEKETRVTTKYSP